MEGVLKAPPDSTNCDLMNNQEVPDYDSGSAAQSNNSVSTSPSVSRSIPFRDPYLPEDDGSILTPEHAFIQYQTRSEDQACQICSQPAVGFHHRAYVCEACKKFFMRHTAARFRQSESGAINPADTVCPMGGNCRIEGPGRGKCPHCRYRKCLDLGMTLTPPGGESGCDISQIPCRVCGGPSSGFHFGALTCEGCKGFFRRTFMANPRLECLSNNDCPITPSNRNMCKSCRFQRCLAVGMSKDGSRIGRQPNAIKYYCAREISQITNTPGEVGMSETGAQPRSSLSPVSNGRSSVGRNRTVSVSSDSDRGGGIQPPNSLTQSRTNPANLWSSPLGIADHGGVLQQAAHSSTRESPHFNPACSPSLPMATGAMRRCSLDAGQPPDSSPCSVVNRKRKLSSDRYGTHVIGGGGGGGGLSGKNNNNNGMLNPTIHYSMDVSPPLAPLHATPQQQMHSGSFASPALEHAEVDRIKYGSSPTLLQAGRLHGLSGRFTRDWTADDERRSHVYDLPTSMDVTSTPLEYSLPNPDTSTHIISSTTMPRLLPHEGASNISIHNNSTPLSRSSTRNSDNNLLSPLAVHLPPTSLIPEHQQCQYRPRSNDLEEVQLQYKMLAAAAAVAVASSGSFIAATNTAATNLTAPSFVGDGRSVQQRARDLPNNSPQSNIHHRSVLDTSLVHHHHMHHPQPPYTRTQGEVLDAATSRSQHLEYIQQQYNQHHRYPSHRQQQHSPLPSSNLTVTSSTSPPSSGLSCPQRPDMLQPENPHRVGRFDENAIELTMGSMGGVNAPGGGVSGEHSMSRTTRSIVDHLTSTVLQLRNQHNHRLGGSQKMANSGLEPIGLHRSTGASPQHDDMDDHDDHMIKSSRSIPAAAYSSRMGELETDYPTSLAASSGAAYSTSIHQPCCKPYTSRSTMDPVSRHQKSTTTSHNNNHRDSPSGTPGDAIRQYRQTSLNGTGGGGGGGVGGPPEHLPVVDVTSTSSTSWFAAAAAAAVANALMVASQSGAVGTGSSGEELLDDDDVDEEVRLFKTEALTGGDMCGSATQSVLSMTSADHPVSSNSRRSTSGNVAKRLRMGSAHNNNNNNNNGHSNNSRGNNNNNLYPVGFSSNSSPGDHNNSLYGLKCDQTTTILRSLQQHAASPINCGGGDHLLCLPTSHSVASSTSSSSTASGSPNFAAMQAAAAAAAAAATAASLVLSSTTNSRRHLRAVANDDHGPPGYVSVYSPGGSAITSSPNAASSSNRISPPLVSCASAVAAVAMAAATAVCASTNSGLHHHHQAMVDYARAEHLSGLACSSSRNAAVAGTQAFQQQLHHHHPNQVSPVPVAETTMTPVGSMQVTSSTGAGGGKDGVNGSSGGVGSTSRSRNGIRAIHMTFQDFSLGIHQAAKYLLSERKQRLRNTATHPCPPLRTLENLEQIWSRMMQHFELHSRFIVHFVKLIPGFNQLELVDKRQLVRGAMYPLMLLELSRDYGTKRDGPQYNYFDFGESDREVILKHFPTFHTITGHLIQSGEFLTKVRLDNVELSLVCAQEVFKNFHSLIDPAATEHLYHLADRVLADYIAKNGKPMDDRLATLRNISPLLEELNMEHHQVIAQLRQDKPQLYFPELYTEMFQLTEAEELDAAEQAAAALAAADEGSCV